MQEEKKDNDTVSKQKSIMDHFQTAEMAKDKFYQKYTKWAIKENIPLIYQHLKT
jgi:hypothetical protein